MLTCLHSYILTCLNSCTLKLLHACTPLRLHLCTPLRSHLCTPKRLHLCTFAPFRPYTLARTNGLTLIELVVVMTILVLLAFVAAPSFVSVTKSSQVRTAAQQIVAVLRYARAKANSLGRPVLVSFDREQKTVAVLLPSDILERRLTVSPQSPVTNPELTDEDWWKLSGERFETLDPDQFAVDPSPMGRQRSLPEDVEIVSVRDLETGDDLNLVAFYPDGTASGAEIVLANDRLSIALQVSPLTGNTEVQEISQEELSQRQR
ncbi:MAG: GspH/FimT family pseudopilin [Armatimonadetes bacterium]|nr:GspH/FimT family pseudopilin [Armatimonadota bacterium]MDW8027602.1 GspH/FimT family pseudopilin [Armatimonadota bacterium]